MEPPTTVSNDGRFLLNFSPAYTCQDLVLCRARAPVVQTQQQIGARVYFDVGTRRTSLAENIKFGD